MVWGVRGAGGGVVGEGVGSGNFDNKRERDSFFLLGWDAGKGKVAGYSNLVSVVTAFFI